MNKYFVIFYLINGYFVIYNEKGIVGSQCCDIIAIKNNIPMLIECKNLKNKNGIFPISRIEQNQISACRKFCQCGNSIFILAINWKENIYFFHLDKILNSKIKNIDLKKEGDYDYENFYRF